MTGIDHGLGGQMSRLVKDAMNKDCAVAAGEVGAAHRAGKQSVAGKDKTGGRHIIAYTTGRMSGSGYHINLLLAKIKFVAVSL